MKTAFLHGDLDEDIYMEQPEGFVVDSKSNLVCKLKKSLFDRSIKDACVYFKKLKNDCWVYLLLHVDDMLVASKDKNETNKLKLSLKSKFETKNLGEERRIFSMETVRDRKHFELKLTQKEYIEKVLCRFSMENAKASYTPLPLHMKLSNKGSPILEEDKTYMAKVPYASAVGSLMYAMVCTGPDIANAIGMVSRYMANPGKSHWEAVKLILRYLRGTSSHGLVFGGSKAMDCKLVGYCDSNYAGDRD